MYVNIEDIGEIKQVKILNRQTGEYMLVIPKLGGMLNGLGLSKKGKVYEVLDNSENYQTLLEEGIPSYKGSKLFPFPNRIDKGEYFFQDSHYQLEKNHIEEGHAIHGLVYKSEFIIDSLENANNGILNLLYTSTGNEIGYPFLYELRLQYVLSDDGFKCITTVENKDNTSIPVGDGWHPYFTTGSLIDHLFIRIPSNEYLELDTKMIPTGKVNVNSNYLSLKTLRGMVLDTCFKLPENEGIQSVEIFDPKRDIKINVWQETGKDKYNYVQLYTPPSRKSIAIEPMSCLPDSFNNKHGLIILAPGEKRTFTYGVKLQ